HSAEAPWQHPVFHEHVCLRAHDGRIHHDRFWSRIESAVASGTLPSAHRTRSSSAPIPLAPPPLEAVRRDLLWSSVVLTWTPEPIILKVRGATWKSASTELSTGSWIPRS